MIGRTYQFIISVVKENINDGSDIFKVSMVDVGGDGQNVELNDDSDGSVDPSVVMSVNHVNFKIIAI